MVPILSLGSDILTPLKDLRHIFDGLCFSVIEPPEGRPSAPVGIPRISARGTPLDMVADVDTPHTE